MARIETTTQEIINGGGILLEEYLGYDIQNGESDLIVKQDILYKIIERTYHKNKQPIMEFFHDTSGTFPFEIFNLYYENKQFFSYSMPFYEEYITLYKVLKSDITLAERKQIALELMRIYQTFLSYKIVYYDWHSKNVLYKEILKLLDVDSGKMTMALQYDAKARRNLFHLCFELLLAEDFDYDWTLDKRIITDLEDELIGKEEMLLSKTIPLCFSFMEKEIKSYTKTKVECQKERILRKWKVL